MKQTLIQNDKYHLMVEWGYEDCPFLHLDIFQWSPSLYREYKIVWQEVLKWFEQQGYNEVFILIPDNDPKLYKFETKFGFTEVSREDGEILMMCGVEYGH